MINVNLLPPELRPIRRSGLPYIIVAVAGTVVVIALLSIFMANKLTVANNEAELEGLKADLQRVRESAKQVKELEAKKASVEAKDKAIRDINSDRIVWSKQLYYLARLMPDQVWLKDVEVETKTRTETVPVPDAPEGQPQTKQVPVPYQSLKLTGYALSYKEEMGVNLVGVFVNAIENDTDFTTFFKSPEPQLLKDEEFGGVNVKEFEVNCEIVTGKGKKETPGT
jgi:Tfp pilus assembly protein PilN